MIKDPIRYTSNKPVYNDGINTIYFLHVISDSELSHFEHIRLMTDTGNCGDLIDIKPEKNILFSIVKDGYSKSNDHCYWHQSSNEDNIKAGRYHKNCSVSIFLDELQILYPDYFEWFLFHPEWL